MEGWVGWRDISYFEYVRGVGEEFMVVHEGAIRTGFHHLQLPHRPLKIETSISQPSPQISPPWINTHIRVRFLPSRKKKKPAFCFQPTDSVCLRYRPTDSFCLGPSSSWPSFYFHPAVLTWKCHDLASCVRSPAVYGWMFVCVWVWKHRNEMLAPFLNGTGLVCVFRRWHGEEKRGGRTKSGYMQESANGGSP